MKKNINTVNGLGDTDLEETSPYLGVGDTSTTDTYLRKMRIKSKRYRLYSKIVTKKIVKQRSSSH